MTPRKRWSFNERNSRDIRVTEFDELGIENVVLFAIFHNAKCVNNFALAILAAP
jgi:hypothetical protein